MFEDFFQTVISSFPNQDNEVVTRFFASVEYARISAFRRQDSVPFLKFSLFILFTSSQPNNTIKVIIFKLERSDPRKRLTRQGFPCCDKFSFRDDFFFYLDSFEDNQSCSQRVLFVVNLNSFSFKPYCKTHDCGCRSC
jgi:hypothetical protein